MIFYAYSLIKFSQHLRPKTVPYTLLRSQSLESPSRNLRKIIHRDDSGLRELERVERSSNKNEQGGFGTLCCLFNMI